MTVFSDIRNKIQNEVDRCAEHVKHGTPEDYAEYKHMVGRIQGLLSAIQHVTDLERNYMEPDDD